MSRTEPAIIGFTGTRDGMTMPQTARLARALQHFAPVDFIMAIALAPTLKLTPLSGI